MTLTCCLFLGRLMILDSGEIFKIGDLDLESPNSESNVVSAEILFISEIVKFVLYSFEIDLACS